MDPTIRQLIDLIPPPNDPDPFTDMALNAAYGPSVPLPADYVEFMRVYGRGWFTEDGHPRLQILDLASIVDKETVVTLFHLASEANSAYPDDFPPCYPAVPGLLPWGADDSGYTYYWWIEPNMSSWHIAVDARVNVKRYDCCFVEFILDTVGLIPGGRFYRKLIREQSLVGYCPESRV